MISQLEAVLDYNLNLSRKCFALAKTLLSQGDAIIKTAIEKSFIYSFSLFAKRDETERKRLKFFMPDDFYTIFLHKIEKPELSKEPALSMLNISIDDITLRLANREDWIFAKQITGEMQSSAINRGCGISKRSPLSVIRKMLEGKAIIAVTPDNKWAGFSYIETYENNEFVSNSGLIVAPAYRQCGVAKAVKQHIFELSRTLYPNAKIFSITTGAAVMKMNTRLGFEPVTYGEITREKQFWQGCKSCVNYQTLLSKDCKNCFCTAMLCVPEQEEPQEEENECETEHHY
ncbi:hypothetical protein [Dyadobacter sp. NIV53]|uniref:DUF7674 family protein n=1 Tax=Dyadobacter sp. NIV53 TaxID=2861765 RepID=UPI001C88356B|nr:hypothetical protein [Dyadobacter sp. NIV53]